ncbi:PAS domain-containing protein [Thalassotalea ganghwensis]
MIEISEHDNIDTPHHPIVKNAELLFRDSFDAVIITSATISSPKIQYANPKFCQLTGYSLEELLGKTPKILQGDKTNPHIINRLRECLGAGNSFIGATVNYRKDGSEYHVEWKINPIVNQRGNVIGYLSVQMDLTFLKNLLLRLSKTTHSFREFLNEFLHNKEYKQVSNNVKQQTNVLTQQELSNMALFSESLRSEQHKEIYDDELFFCDDEPMGVMPVHHTRTKISALEYSKLGVTNTDDIDNLKDIIDECVSHIELARQVNNEGSKYMLLALADIQEFANVVFFIDEFIDISTVLGQLVSSLKQSPELLEQGFAKQIVYSLVLDLQTWLENVFIEKTSADIHELDDSIISSAKQLIFMIK